MERYVLIIALICASTRASPLTTKQYRLDYVYNKQTDAFYKLHTESLRTKTAQKICEVESAILMVPTTPQDIQQVHAMFKKFPDLGEYVLVGSDKLQHDEVDEQPIMNLEIEQEGFSDDCEVVTRSGDISTISCWQSAPFICKVDAREAPYDEQCAVFGRNYISKISTTGSCYKIPRIPYTWNEADAECKAEGAHLVILNSEGEHEEVTRLIQTEQPVPDAETSYFFFAGIRAHRTKDGTPRVFKTVLNQTLEEAGYIKWSDNEPNNYQDSEYCGSLFKNDGKYNDLGCPLKEGFVCEKERKIV